MVRWFFGRIPAVFGQIFVHIEAKLRCAGGLKTRFLKFASHRRYLDVIIHLTAKKKKISLKTSERLMTLVEQPKKRGGYKGVVRRETTIKFDAPKCN
jgi:hypothetical protein